MAQESDSILTNSFDGIINRIGFGFYQIYASLPLGLFAFVEGTMITTIAISEEALIDEWNLEEWQLAMLFTITFIGITLGAYMGGAYSDIYGRLLIFNSTSWALLAFGMILVFIPEYYSFLVIRGLYGVSVGFKMPAAAAYGSEICPVKYRGPYMIFLECFFTLGQIYIVGITYLLMPGLEDKSKFRELIFISMIPMIFANILALFVMREVLDS